MIQNHTYSPRFPRVTSLALSIPFLTTSNLSAAGAIFDIRYTIQALDTQGTPNNINSQILAVLADVEAELESLIPTYQDGMIGAASIGPIEIKVIDNVGLLGGANNYTSVTDNSGFSLRTSGSLRFDADILFWTEDPTRYNLQRNVIIHETLHILGIGGGAGNNGGWSGNGLYDASSPDLIDPNTGEVVGAYTGANALLAYQTEFDQPGATYVPVSRTISAHSHWHQADGVPNGVISNITGLDFSNEMLTPALSRDGFVSTVTLGSLVDMGFTLAVPEPSSTLLFSSAFGLLIFRRRRA